MNDLALRLARLEGTVRRLRFLNAVLAVALIGLVAMGAAPAPGKPPTELIFESEGRKVMLSSDGLVVSGPEGVTRIGAARVEARSGTVAAELSVERKAAYIGVAREGGKYPPASASLRADDLNGADANAQLLVTDQSKSTVIFPGQSAVVMPAPGQKK